jgi:two-component system, OmpR family, phosphate regulon sensor histidine kinase PhoR
LKKRSIGIIIGLMTMALLGVMAMQLYFLKQSYDLQSKLFGRDVHEALDNVADKLTRLDAFNFYSQKAQQIQQKKGDSPIGAADNAQQNDQVVIKDSTKTKRLPGNRDQRLLLLRDSLQRMILHQKMDDELAESVLQVRIDQYIDEFGIVQVRYTPLIMKAPNSKRKPHKWDTLRIVYADPQFGDQVIITKHLDPQWKAQQAKLQKIKQMHQVEQMIEADSLQNANAGRPNVMQSLWEEFRKSDEPLKKRISAFIIDSLLRFELMNKGIVNMDYNYEVSTVNTDSVIFSKAINTNGIRPQFLPADTYQTQIFSKEVFNDPGLIKISFPQKNAHILSTMTATMGTTAGLLFVLIFCFGYILFAIIRQKKVSEMKTDFINNMTHEFKTPVSTIMIASDALRDNEIVEDKSRINRLANIIYEENARLGSHIERVLNIARIDNNDFKLEKKPVDINEMVALVVDSMELKLKKSNAIVNMNLDAENAIIKADELHFSNLLYNLVDNAIKYSKDQPEITISTLNKNGHVIIRVSDKGIGMSRDQQTKIFEQFYRIPTGNLHDVKGFGLGLSYVNTIVKRLNGTIGVKSEKDKGSEFELKFSVA